MLSARKVAIVYDWLDKWGGVERVLLTLSDRFPKADFFTSYYDQEKAIWAKNLKIKTSFIQYFPRFIRESRIASVPFYPYAFESFNFSEYELVISVTSSFAKSIITRPETRHICYLLTPTRYLWVSPDDYIKNMFLKTAFSPYLAKLRNWDFIAAQRPDKIISISKTVANRCMKFYQRESEVIYPPFDIEYWNRIKLQTLNRKSKAKFKRKYFLIVSRLEPYKKVELVIQSINQLGYDLIIVGEGSEAIKLKKTAGESVIFLSKVTDEELANLYSNAEALLMPQEEDFGYVSLEAQFFNCPVIAYNKGGASETIIDGKTGIFFEKQTLDSLSSALERFGMVKYKLKQSVKKYAKTNVDKFAKKLFNNKFLNNL